MVTMSLMKALAPDGRCHTFDASACGYGRGEGCVAVVLRSLEDAENDCDAILAVVPFVSVNHDGKAAGLTVPSLSRQVDLIKGAFIGANIKPSELDVLEAHGTGTALGDPIEIAAVYKGLLEVCIYHCSLAKNCVTELRKIFTFLGCHHPYLSLFPVPLFLLHAVLFFSGRCSCEKTSVVYFVRQDCDWAHRSCGRFGRVSENGAANESRNDCSAQLLQ